MHMRKELIGIILFFLAVFTLISLLSYSPLDPSLHHAVSSAHVHNLLGLPGASLAGALAGFFGMAAFWIPAIFLLLSIPFFLNAHKKRLIRRVSGGILLIVTTGCLLTFRQSHYLIFGINISAGGIIGTLVPPFLISHATFTGSLLLLILAWGSGLVLAAGIPLTPLMTFETSCRKKISAGIHRVRTQVVIRRERRKRKKAVSSKL